VGQATPWKNSGKESSGYESDKRGGAASSSLPDLAFVLERHLRIAPDLLIPWKMAEPIPDTTNEVYTP
jgi:hypothetical protein